MLDEALDLFTWKRFSGVPGSVYVATIERIARAFNGVLQDLQKSEESAVASLRAKLVWCSEASLLRILTAPETFARLCGNTDKRRLLSFIEESAIAELCRCGKVAESSGPVWTALGDYYCPGSIKDALSAKEIYGLPIDVDSPYAASEDIPIVGTRYSAQNDSQGQIMCRLEHAFNVVSKVSYLALEFVRRHTRVIIIRQDPVQITGFLSSSSPRYVGRTVLCNPELASVEELAEAVLHEAIHSFLCGVQLVSPFVFDHKLLSATTINSPWTGNRLPSDALVEACFVWFGLWNFWDRALQRSGFVTEEAKRLRMRSSKGFRGPSLVELLTGVRSALSDEALYAIESMQRTVSAATDHSILLPICEGT